MGKRFPDSVVVSPNARAVLAEYGVEAAELFEAWMDEPDEILILTRGERSVVVIFEDRGILQMLTPAEIRRARDE